MKPVVTKTPKVIPCRDCGATPLFRIVEYYLALDGTWLSRAHEVKCPTAKCNQHKHFRPRATKREAAMAWNRSNK